MPGRVLRSVCTSFLNQRVQLSGLVRHAGYYSINSLRLEKAYRAWGTDLTPDYSPRWRPDS